MTKKEKEIKKKTNNRDSRSLNKSGDRLKWVRLQLNLTQAEVCNNTGIPGASYCGREAGVRTVNSEEWLVLAKYFNKLWKERFTKQFPKYNENEMRRITASFL